MKDEELEDVDALVEGERKKFGFRGVKNWKLMDGRDLREEWRGEGKGEGRISVLLPGR